MIKYFPFALLTMIGLYLAPTPCFADDLVIANFEGPDYGVWKTEGTAFGDKPAPGSIEGQMPMAGFLGAGLASSFHGGDGATGTLTSPKFVIQRPFISFLIGGGMDPDLLGIRLLIDGKAVRFATGTNARPGGSEDLAWANWDVAEFKGKSVRIEIYDQAMGGWGHISIDQIVQSDTPEKTNSSERSIKVDQPWLLLPVKNGAPSRVVMVSVDGKPVRYFDISLADGEPDWWAELDLMPWQGKKITVSTGTLPAGSKALEQIQQVKDIPNRDQDYNDLARGQLRFSSRVGGMNDPNGLVYSQGLYHMFYQHNPYGVGGGNTLWGHATSPDLVHWTELPIAIYPKRYGDYIFSGSAVIDKNNTSGWKTGTNDLLVAAFTTWSEDPARRGDCIAYSNDRGMTWTQYEGNPIIVHKTDGRDPRLIWHEATKQWVLAVFNEDRSIQEPSLRNGIDFYTSPDLKKWTFRSHSGGYYECADLFELPLENGEKKWVLTAADSRYRIGTFDGEKFVPETPQLMGMSVLEARPWRQGFYATQTFNSEPKGRRVQFGWFQSDTTGKTSFNQSMSLPNELKLKTTPAGPRLTWTPVPELEALREKTHHLGGQTLVEAGPDPLAGISGELLELRASFDPGTANQITFNLRGIPITFSPGRSELSVGDKHAFVTAQNGKFNLTVYLDRNGIDVYANDGLVFMPIPLYPDAGNKSLSLTVTGGVSKFDSLDVYNLKSSWQQ